jgi:hypothetical protein
MTSVLHGSWPGQPSSVNLVQRVIAPRPRAYWIWAKAGSAQGWELGKQTAAASLRVTLGSTAGGLLFNVAALPGASFVLTAGLTVLGFLLSLGLPHLLVPWILGGWAFTSETP